MMQLHFTRLFIMLAFAVAYSTSCTDAGQVHNADLFFLIERSAQVSDDDMSSAIIDATGSDEPSATHVGIIEVEDDSVFVIDASPSRGVSRRTLGEFKEALAKSPETCVMVMRLKVPFDDKSVIERAKSCLGLPYDFGFLPDNDSYYCSELVQSCYVDDEGEPVFESHPMNFRDAEGNCPEYWQTLFAGLGVPVPQGVPGTNPNDMMHSPSLIRVNTSVFDLAQLPEGHGSCCGDVQ